jgi:hypothetical protein
MKRLAAFIAPALLVSLLAGGRETERPSLQTLSVPGVPVALSFRALQPGEVILAGLKHDPTVRRVVLRFSGETRTIESGAGGAAPFALFGLDLGVKPGVYPLEVKVERLDGSAESSSSNLAIEAKDFPSTRLNVAPSMATPPAAEQERIKREQELVAAVLSIRSPLWLADGPFILPLPDFEPFPNFGQRRVYNTTVASIHAGVDIGAPAGTRTIAANAGRVVLAGDLFFSGHTVIIDHGLGVFTYYCHFSKLMVRRGDLVKKGDIIALVGSTGRSTGPHLHWSVRIGSARVDPFSLVALLR